MLDYKKLIEQSMLDMIKGILTGIAKDGLPGNHHFYITFHTNNSHVKIPQWMLEKYPEKMTIVIRNWFDDFKISSNHFEITLNFSNQPERLTVPFESIEFHYPGSPVNPWFTLWFSCVFPEVNCGSPASPLWVP